MPPLRADGRISLQSWLGFYRATLADQCAGPAEQQLRGRHRRPVTADPVRIGAAHGRGHCRNWSHRVLADERVPLIYERDADADGSDDGFAVAADASCADARRALQQENAGARANCAARKLDDTGPFAGVR